MSKKKLEELRAAKSKLVEDAKAVVEKAKTDDRDFTAEEREMLQKNVKEGRDLAAQIAEVEGDDDLSKALDDLGGIGIDPDEVREKRGKGKSAGERFVHADAWVDYLKSVAPTSGQIAKGTRVHSPPVHFEGLKDILTGSESDRAGALIDDDFLGLLDGLAQFQRPLTLVNLITRGTTDSDTVSYARVASTTNNAEPTAEATGTSAGTGSGDVAGTKPESDMTLEQVTEAVKTIPHWIPATKRALADAGQLRTLIDQFLLYGLDEELEDQIAGGDGTGENFEGILEVSGIQAQVFDTDVLATARKAKTLVRTNGRTVATAYLLNPEDNETIDLTKDDQGRYYFGGPAAVGTQTLWGLPRVECEAIPAGTGLVGNFRMATLWDRMQATIQASDSHEDFFIRNLVAILAELRAAFGVIRPPAFCTFEFSAGS